MPIEIEALHHPHVPEEKGELFHSYDSQSTEEEYLYLLYAITYCLKPRQVLETGSYQGYGSSYIGAALRRNGSGHLTSLEHNDVYFKWAEEQVESNGLEDWVSLVKCESLEFLGGSGRKFDLAFFDSTLPLRTKEFSICLERGLLDCGSMAAFHDTSRLRTDTPGHPDPQTPLFWEEFLAIADIRFIEFPFSRGMILAQVL